MNELLSIKHNTTLNTLNSNDLQELKHQLEIFYLEFRSLLELPSSLTFGHEIEYRNANRNLITDQINTYFSTWQSKKEETISHFNSNPFLGGEISSPPLTNTKETYQDLNIICNLLKDYPYITAINTGAHLHIGAKIYERKSLYYLRLLKLWIAFEDIIYRFGNGEYISYRPEMVKYAPPVGNIYKEILKNDFINADSPIYFLLQAINLGKSNCLNFENLVTKRYNTIEIRCPNGTLNPIILQNNLNFFAHLLLYPVNPEYNEETISKYYQETTYQLNNNQLNLKKALELADLIFSNNYDKLCFLKQYLKASETTLEYKLTRKLTI